MDKWLIQWLQEHNRKCERGSNASAFDRVNYNFMRVHDAVNYNIILGGRDGPTGRLTGHLILSPDFYLNLNWKRPRI